VDGPYASIVITVIDEQGVGIAGVTGDGVWTYHDRRNRTRTRTASGVTAAGGDVMFTLGLPKGGGVDSFCLTSVTAPGYEFVMPPISCGYPLE